MQRLLATSLAPVILLAACSGGADDKTSQDKPEGSGNDLAGETGASGQGTTAVADIDRSSRAVESARARAAQLVGGRGELVNAPQAERLADGAPPSDAMIAAARAAVAPGGENCGEKVEYSSAWAAKLPPAFPVYPRSSTREAAGSDEGACALRIVSFLTPVPLGDVLAFYHTRAKAAGFGVDHVETAGDNVLSGTKGRSAYVVYGRRLPSGLTEIDLVTTD